VRNRNPVLGLLALATLWQGAACAEGGPILVKGAWSSSSDSVTPLPEGGKVVDHTYSNEYFDLSYSPSREWTEGDGGPPPSPSGYYVLAQIEPAAFPAGMNPGHMLIAAQDMFFTLVPANSAFELINVSSQRLDRDYKVERPPTEVRIANHSFVRFDYMSPVAKLHWHVLATEVRCHTIQFVFTSRDAKLMENVVKSMNTMRLPANAGTTAGNGGGGIPLCIKDFANTENLITRVDPILVEPRFNPIPVRIIVGKDGKVKHIHFLSAFADQVKSISDALSQWQFKPYLLDGRPVEVETGIMFGRMRRAALSPESEARPVTTAFHTPTSSRPGTR